MDGLGRRVTVTCKVEKPFDGRVLSFTQTYASPAWDKTRVSWSTLRFIDASTLTLLLTEAGLPNTWRRESRCPAAASASSGPVFFCGKVDHGHATLRQPHEECSPINARQQCRLSEDSRFISNNFTAIAKRASCSNSVGV